MKRLILIALAIFISASAAPKKEKDAEAYFNRGLAYGLGKGQHDQAISDFTKAIELNPRDAMAYDYRGVPIITKASMTRLSPITIRLWKLPLATLVPITTYLGS